MAYILAFNYACLMLFASLAVGALRFEVLRGSASRWKAAGFLLIGFPLLLLLRELLASNGPAFWRQSPPGIGRIGAIVLGFWLSVGILRGLMEWALLARDAHQEWKQSIPGNLLQNAPEVGYHALCREEGLATSPDVRIVPGLSTPKVALWEFKPHVLFPASQVPRALRSDSYFWEEVPAEDIDWTTIRHHLVHELRHIRAGDHWRHHLRALVSGLTFWEWGVEGASLRKFWLPPRPSTSHLGRTIFESLGRIVDGISRLTAWLGAPFRRACRLDWDVQEALARQDRPGPETSSKRLARQGFKLGMLLVATMALVLAPGREDLHRALLGDHPNHQALPAAWSFMVPVGPAQAQAYLETDPKGQRRVIVDVDRVPHQEYSTWPRLKTSGNLDQPLSEHTSIIMRWDFYWDGHGDLPPMAHLWISTRLDPIRGMDTLDPPAFLPPTPMGNGRYRISQVIHLAGTKASEFRRMEISIAFRRAGRYVLLPPQVTYESGDAAPL